MTDYTITKFGVANFKAISQYTEIEFNPVTLLIGDSGSGKTSLLSALITFVESKEADRYLDVQPFYFDNAGKYLNFENVKNKYTSKESCIEYRFRVAKKRKVYEFANIPNEVYDVSIKFGMDTDRIRLKETTIKVIFENGDDIELLHLLREEKRHILKLNLLYILELTKAKYPFFFDAVYEPEADKFIGDLVSYDIVKEIMEMGYKGFTEDRRFENGVYFPKSMFGVLRYYKYYLCEIFFKKYGEDLSSTQYKCARKVIDSVYGFMIKKLSLITDAIDMKYIECAKIKVERCVLPAKFYNENIFKKKLIDYIEEKKYDNNVFNILTKLLQENGIAEDISIEGDYTDGYSIYITDKGAKTNLADVDVNKQHIIGTILMVLMNGKFNLCFRGEEKIKYYEPDYLPIIILNPEYNLNEEHQEKFAGIIGFLSNELHTQIVIETQSKVIIDKFKETGNAKVYYFSKNEKEPSESPMVMGFGNI